MDTLRITKVEGKTAAKSGTMYYQVTFEDGRKATTFDAKVSNLTGALVGVEFEQKGAFLNFELKNVIARADAPSVAGIPYVQPAHVAPEKPTANPIFAFLGACALASPMVLESFTAGNNVEDTLEAVKANFSRFMELSFSLLETHMNLDEIKKAADKLMN